MVSNCSDDKWEENKNNMCVSNKLQVAGCGLQVTSLKLKSYKSENKSKVGSFCCLDEVRSCVCERG